MPKESEKWHRVVVRRRRVQLRHAGADRCFVGALAGILQYCEGMEEGEARVQAEELVRGEAARCSRCLLYTSPSPRDRTRSRMPSSA